MAKKDETAVAKKGETALVNADVPEYLREDMVSQQGNENIGSEDISIPRVKLAQALSKEIDKNESKFIKGLEQGQFFNSLTQHNYGEEFTFVTFAFEKNFPVFKTRKAGGGLVVVCDTATEAAEAIEKHPEKDKLEAVETVTHYGFALNQETGEWDMVALPTYGTGLTASKNINTLAKMSKGARWTRMYRIFSMPDKNNQGLPFQRIKAEQAPGWPSEELVADCRGGYEIFSAGKFKKEFDHEAPASEGPTDSDEY